jgi:nucleoredoxin
MKFRLRLLRPLLIALLPFAAQAAIETWTGSDGLPTQAEFIRRNGDLITFQKPTGASYLLPYAKLSESERARIDVLTSRKTSAAPTAAAAAAAPDKAATGKVLAPLVNQLVYLKGSTLLPLPAASLSGVRFVAVYYSAHWCPPCRAFTPELVSAYKSIKAAHPEFELIFVSSDRDEESMKAYMRETAMTWPTLSFGQKGSASTLKRPAYERGIPNLVFMTADGKELATTYTTGGDYEGPKQVLAAIQRHFKK